MWLLNRLFTRGVYGSTNDEAYRVKRTVSNNGNSFTVSIPPITVEELGLLDGVWLQKKGKKLIITKKGE